ncbi:MAG: SDR family oxidoreductase [Myxococcales bacterium]|nr:SDR family oxidoreductase [Myxococcales bacterium]
MSKRSVSGKVVVITGGGGGIGAALGEVWAAKGAKVALLDLNLEAAQAAADKVTAAGHEAMALSCNVCDADSRVAAISAVQERWGGVDVLINNAGITHRSLFADTEDRVLAKVIEVNLFGAIGCTRAAWSDLIARKGQIIAISSVAGFAPLLGRTAYAASKHAMSGFFSTLRAELAPHGVSVLMVYPAFTDTGLDKSALDKSGEAMNSDRKPVGKQMTPEFVAKAILAAAEADRRELLLSPVAKASRWLWRFTPRLYERMMVRSQQAEFDAQ